MRPPRIPAAPKTASEQAQNPAHRSPCRKRRNIHDREPGRCRPWQAIRPAKTPEFAARPIDRIRQSSIQSIRPQVSHPEGVNSSADCMASGSASETSGHNHLARVHSHSGRKFRTLKGLTRRPTASKLCCPPHRPGPPIDMVCSTCMVCSILRPMGQRSG